MAKIKIYELAKELDKPSKDIVTFLNQNGVEVKSHMSSIDDNAISLVKKHFASQNSEKQGVSETSLKADTSNKQPSSDNNKNKANDGMNSTQNKNSANQYGGQKQGQKNLQQRQTGEGQNSYSMQQKTEDNQNINQQEIKPVDTQNQQNNSTTSDNRNQGRNQGYNQNRNQGNRQSGDGQNRSYGQNRQGQGNNQGNYNNQNRSYGNNPNNRSGQSGQGNSQYRNNNRPDGQGQRNNNGQQQNRPYNNNQRPYNNQGQQRSGQFNNGFNRNGSQGGQGGFDRFSVPNKDKDDYGKDNERKRSTSRDNGPKKFDAPIGMSRSDVSGTRNRANKNSKNSKANYEKDYDNDTDEIKLPKKGQFIKPKPVEPVKVEDEIKTIVIPDVLTIKELADKMKLPAATLVKKLFLAGKMVSINQEITFEEAEEIAIEYEIIAEREEKVDVIEELLKEDEDSEETLEKRPPVVCVMGHVDHGKTSLLDAIRQSNVTSHEAGGITQHIGAYVVEVNGEKITFLDTPGHEAFTSMRMRGAKSTDIAILVVAADDGVMPQTIEAISHAKAAGIEIIVAINKIDKPSANIERVKQELTEYELIPEDWGGSTIFVPVSAHTKEGIDQLLEMILLTAEIIELKANPNRRARGIVIEAELDKGRGPVATILVQKGTLHVGDAIAIGSAYGKVRAMMDDKGRRVKEATPSTPVEILGLNEVPDAGEIFIATENEKEARSIAETYISQGREKLLADTKAKLSLDGLFSQIKAGNIKELNIIIKADVQGSVEAMKQSLLKLSNEEVAIRVIHGGVGAINESDVNLASASNAIIIGFNVRPDNVAKERAESEKVDLRLYRVIYNAIEDVENAMKGMLEPTYEEKVIGHAEVRQVFKASGLGVIAGSYVLDGKIVRGCLARISRDGKQIFDGALASLKRFKDDVKEVASGYECGLVFEKFNDIKEFDQVELYIMQEVPR